MPGRIRQDVATTPAPVRSRQRAGEGVTPTGIGSVSPVPPNQPTSRRTARWRLSNWRLRWKLLIVLLVPLITAVALGALRVTSQLQSAGVYDTISEQIRLASSLDEVIDNLQKEREQITLFVTSGGSAGSPPGSAATSETDAAIVSFRQLTQTDGDVDAATGTAVTNALNSLSDLNSLRNAAKATKFPEIDVLAGYNQILGTLVQSTELVSAGAPNQRVSQLVSGLFDIRTAKEQYTLTNAILMMTVTPVKNADGSAGPGWVFLPGTETQLNAAEAGYETAVTTFNDSATAADQQMYLDTVTGPDVDSRAQLLTLIQTRADGQLGPPAAGLESVQPTTVQHAGDGGATQLEEAEENLNRELTSVTDNLAAQAKDQAVRDGAILAAALLIAFLVTLFVARSLVQSLRRLRSGALEVARTKLPQSVQRILADPDPIKASNQAVEPVPVFTADEIGEVARSFDVVHGQAVRLAAEQAVLRDNVNAIFINLSRRSQALVERQLALIDRLEKDEQDPDQLSNLFELDHLATRMRRNSESLLVLSGSGLAKRMSRPVPIGELVGAAVSEVEQYARIDVGAPPAASVLGRVVNDLIHLIAELLDNATSYSEPNTRVSVRIARTRSRELAIQVTDRGVGMSEDDVRLANERLANPPDIDVGVTRRMGLYVVARLARRHNIRVKLRANEDIDGGTVALIVIPEDLVHRPGEEQRGPLGTADNLAPAVHQAGMIDTFPPPGSMQAEPDMAGAASAAAGIAGAFGLASGRSRDETGNGSNGGARNGGGARIAPAPVEPDVLEPATSFWASDFEPSGKLDASSLEDEAGPQTQTIAGSSASLWEAHTAAEAIPTDDRAWQPKPTTNGNGNGNGRPEVDAPTERLPIYEAVLSQWFRADEVQDSQQQPQEAQQAAAAPVAAAPQQQATPAATPAPATAASADSTGLLPTRVPGRAGAALGFGMAPRQSGAGSDNGNGKAASTSSGGNGFAAAAASNGGGDSNGTSTWQSPADEGWSRAEALLAPVSEKTTAGLPKRVPKAHLVPGSAAPRPESSASQGSGGGTTAATLAPPALPPRTADAVRGRMSSFQQGIRRGRHTMVEAYSGEASHSSAHRADEEQE
ncbi:MAG TPA: nitrate- and nitrite sensing domain-containing protein [Pseudonocardiaceae bacterium]|nr:nitrate- and nitrite sensing domain-containing protein [Pseudonocardiaceae bacterium]